MFSHKKGYNDVKIVAIFTSPPAKNYISMTALITVQTRAHQQMRYPNVTWRITLWLLIYHWTTTHLCSEIFSK